MTHADPIAVTQKMAPLIALSPYHQGGLCLSFALGGSGSPIFLIFIIPVALLALGIWLTKKVYPNIYEKE